MAHQREPRYSRPLTETSASSVSVRRWTYTLTAACRQIEFHTFLVLRKLRNAPAKRDHDVKSDKRLCTGTIAKCNGPLKKINWIKADMSTYHIIRAGTSHARFDRFDEMSKNNNISSSAHFNNISTVTPDLVCKWPKLYYNLFSNLYFFHDIFNHPNFYKCSHCVYLRM